MYLLWDPLTPDRLSVFVSFAFVLAIGPLPLLLLLLPLLLHTLAATAIATANAATAAATIAAAAAAPAAPAAAAAAAAVAAAAAAAAAAVASPYRCRHCCYYCCYYSYRCFFYHLLLMLFSASTSGWTDRTTRGVPCARSTYFSPAKSAAGEMSDQTPEQTVPCTRAHTGVVALVLTVHPSLLATMLCKMPAAV